MSNIYLTPDEVSQDMLDYMKSITGIQFDLTNLSREEVIKIKTYANSISMMRSSLRQTYDDIFPGSSSLEGLKKHLASRGLADQIQATPSMGVVRFSNATDGAVIPIGTQVQYSLDGRVFVAITSGTISSGIADVTFQSLLSGQNQNIDQVSQAFTLVTPITGVNSACINQTQFSDGRDLETSAEILVRIETFDQDNDTGGNLAAYERWATEASTSVVKAKSIKNPRGVGTVNTIITSGTTDIAGAVNSGNSITRVPSAGLVALVQAYILTKNPVTDDHLTVLPTEISINMTVKYSLNDETLRGVVNAAILKLVKIYIYEAVPSQILYPTVLERQIDAEVGHLIIERRVSDFSGGGPEYTVPSSNLLIPGTITITTF